MKKIVLLVFVLMLLSTAVVWGFMRPAVVYTDESNNSYDDEKFIFSGSKTIWVPDNFTSIQEAINSASDGDTVFVRNGTYYENVVVNKQIRLLGENSAETIVNANAIGTVLNIVTSNVNLSGFTVRNSGSISPDSGILLQGAANCRIFGNRIVENGGDGVFLIDSSNNVISENEVVGNDVDGISVSGSVNNTISDNNVTGNGWSGIGLFGYSSDNNVISNNVVNNPEGIAVVISGQNEIRENRIVSNSNWGISIYQSVDNRIFHNFFGNSLQVSSDGSPNMWDNGYPSGGNYWSDYTGTDLYSGPYQNETGSDGIGDTSYDIDVNNRDNYPLMGMFYDFTVEIEFGQKYHVYVISNSTVSSLQVLWWLTSANEYLQPGDKYILLDIEGENGTVGLCRIMIPRIVVNNSYVVLADWLVELPFTELPISNSTHAYLYFEYTQPNELMVVPEFPTWTSMLLILIMLTVTIVIYKRRLLKTPIH